MHRGVGQGSAFIPCGYNNRIAGLGQGQAIRTRAKKTVIPVTNNDGDNSVVRGAKCCFCRVRTITVMKERSVRPIEADPWVKHTRSVDVAQANDKGFAGRSIETPDIEIAVTDIAEMHHSIRDRASLVIAGHRYRAPGFGEGEPIGTDPDQARIA